MILRKYYPTIVLSDIHLGSEHSRTEEVTRFLKHVDCDRLILNGDIRDWVESMTALVEDEQGEWEIVTYNNVQLYADAV